jgi:hypothetical protein
MGHRTGPTVGAAMSVRVAAKAGVPVSRSVSGQSACPSPDPMVAGIGIKCGPEGVKCMSTPYRTLAQTVSRHASWRCRRPRSHSQTNAAVKIGNAAVTRLTGAAHGRGSPGSNSHYYRSSTLVERSEVVPSGKCIRPPRPMPASVVAHAPAPQQAACPATSIRAPRQYRYGHTTSRKLPRHSHPDITTRRLRPPPGKSGGRGTVTASHALILQPPLPLLVLKC